ncbi:MAG: hypothetical protein H6R17_2359 [Proteobacteria bacterium]|nr:hypothetical protein [Pseudomonadota bacterium]
MMQTTKQDVAVSPCLNVCTLDAARSLCQGCFRTVAEIAAWSRVSNSERLSIVAAAARRRQELSQ